ncbi:hypothetical protein DRP05_02860 [Archaeoglobales archaeon]|nr:MAG: hypothetical protein DRP05_02860 [Archaeoglobales archaeon]
MKSEPGTGKTIFGLQFLLEGDKSVYISFDEVYGEVILQAEKFGWDLSKIHFIDKVKEMDILAGGTIFYDYDAVADITEFIESITKLEELEDVERVFIDGMGVLRDATKNESIYRRITSSIVNFLNSIGATTIISAEMTDEIGKDIISYRDGKVLRTVEVLKYRGGDAHLGEHYFSITPKGIVVYPVIPVYRPRNFERALLSTGSDELDRLLGGGIYKGSKVYIAGKTGVGKTSLCFQILKENDEKGRLGILYAFDESEDIVLRKYAEIFGYRPKKLIIRRVRNMSLGEFYRMVVEDIELKPEIVVIDPLNAVDEMAISTDEFLSMLSLLTEQLEMLGITFIGTQKIAQPLGEFHFTGVGISRFADYLILGRHMEIGGELLKTIAVVKNRFSNHERTIRILDMEDGKGLKIGEPLKEYSGLMSGVVQKHISP